MTAELYIFDRYPVCRKIHLLCLKESLSKKQISNRLGKCYWAASGILPNIKRLEKYGYIRFRKTSGIVKKRGIYESTLKHFYENAGKSKMAFNQNENRIMESIMSSVYGKCMISSTDTDSYAAIKGALMRAASLSLPCIQTSPDIRLGLEKGSWKLVHQYVIKDSPRQKEELAQLLVNYLPLRLIIKLLTLSVPFDMGHHVTSEIIHNKDSYLYKLYDNKTRKQVLAAYSNYQKTATPENINL
ncbi:MAG: hypothetical protein HYY37_00015 [Candidatus Aenigmarchaeota archaeon]|nr:hypothetical protein [Candidatus Aenigmarchaeota archaeon]